MRVIPLSTTILTVACLLSSCTDLDKEIRQTYRIAGRNKHELKKVIRLYGEMGDTLRLAAADFLIRNMVIHFHYHDRLSDIAVDSLIHHKDEGKEIVPAVTASVWRHGKKFWPWKNRAQRIHDASEINAEVLIDHIDRAVASWKNSPYAAHIDFDQFCELILPYKSNNSKPELWREIFQDKYKWLKDTLDVLGHPPFATGIFHTRINLEAKWDNLILNRDLTSTEISQFKIGNCKQVTAWESSVYRSIGLPTGLFYMPRWASHHQGHYWTAYLDEYGNWRCAQGFLADQSDFMCHEKKIAKAFMWTYGKQPASFRA